MRCLTNSALIRDSISISKSFLLTYLFILTCLFIPTSSPSFFVPKIKLTLSELSNLSFYSNIPSYSGLRHTLQQIGHVLAYSFRKYCFFMSGKSHKPQMLQIRYFFLMVTLHLLIDHIFDILLFILPCQLISRIYQLHSHPV